MTRTVNLQNMSRAVFIDTGSSGNAGSFALTTSIATGGRSFRVKVTYLECSSRRKYISHRLVSSNWISLRPAKPGPPTGAFSSSPALPGSSPLSTTKAGSSSRSKTTRPASGKKKVRTHISCRLSLNDSRVKTCSFFRLLHLPDRRERHRHSRRVQPRRHRQPGHVGQRLQEQLRRNPEHGFDFPSPLHSSLFLAVLNRIVYVCRRFLSLEAATLWGRSGAGPSLTPWRDRRFQEFWRVSLPGGTVDSQ